MKANGAVLEAYGVGVDVTHVRERSRGGAKRDGRKSRNIVRFYRGILFDVVLSIPLWAVIIWLLT